MGQTFTAWSEKEISILRENAGKINAIEIGKIVGRGSDGVRKMAKKLGLPSWEQPRTKSIPTASTKPIKRNRKPLKHSPTPARIKTYVAPSKPLRKPLEEKSRQQLTSYPQVQYCPVCNSPVSDWVAHINRMGWYGCKRPAA